MALTHAGLADSATEAVVAVDISFGSNIYAPSGLHRFIGDSLFTGRPMVELYKSPLAKIILKLSKEEKDYKQQAKQWMQENGPAHTALMDFKQCAYQVDGYQGKFLQNLANALEVLWQIREAEFGLRSRPPEHGDVVKTCVGRELKEVDIEPVIEELVENLTAADYNPIYYKDESHTAVRDWEKQLGVLEKEAMKNEILRLVNPLIETTKRNVLPNLPSYVSRLQLNNFEVSYLPDAWFVASNNYCGDTKPYASTYEFSGKLKLPSPRIETLTRHEAIPGHHFVAVLKHFQIRSETLSPVVGVHTMCTPDCSLNEGIANSGAHILYGNSTNGLNLDQRIALNLEKLDYMGRLNAVAMKFIHGKDTETIKAYLIEKCCITTEIADTIIRRLDKSPINLAYLPSYCLGTQVVQGVLTNYERKGALRTLYGFNGPVDAITLPDMAKEFCKPI